MVKKVGIPRGLFYYNYFPLWRTFFEELGAEVVVSAHTTKQILDVGVKSCVDEACLPLKVYHGHVSEIKDRVDYLFVPRFTSVSKNEYICPKFGGLPDMIRHNFKDLPTLIDTEVNLRKSKKDVMSAVYEIGSYFTKDYKKVEKAYEKALSEYKSFKERVRKGYLPIDILENHKKIKIKSAEGVLNIAVIGHVYNLYDSYINMNLLRKLAGSGVNTITIEMVDSDIIKEKVGCLPKRMFWNFGRKAVGSALHFIERKDIDGIIFLMSFGCGVDSFVCDLIERKIRRSRDIPFTILTIDEHSGEAGLNTRIEAFIDMIRWRNKNESNVSTYGQYVYPG
ncbi:MAG: acyl-CoA dehydratase activase-related protein [Clostridia bacterium]|nr:acyl-CoA dehydratase activase-related protein [Clostridia bacterium]